MRFLSSFVEGYQSVFTSCSFQIWEGGCQKACIPKILHEWRLSMWSGSFWETRRTLNIWSASKTYSLAHSGYFERKKRIKVFFLSEASDVELWIWNTQLHWSEKMKNMNAIYIYISPMMESPIKERLLVQLSTILMDYWKSYHTSWRMKVFGINTTVVRRHNPGNRNFLEREFWLGKLRKAFQKDKERFLRGLTVFLV